MLRPSSMKCKSIQNQQVCWSNMQNCDVSSPERPSPTLSEPCWGFRTSFMHYCIWQTFWNLMFIIFNPIIRTCLMLYSTRQANYYIDIQPNFRQLHSLTISVFWFKPSTLLWNKYTWPNFSQSYCLTKWRLHSLRLYNYIAQTFTTI